jgi:hypothetical protein
VFRSSCIFLIKSICCLCFTISIAEAGYAQAGKWIWMKGDSTFYSWYNKGTIGIEADSVHPPAIYNGAGWTDKEGKFWLFGGLTYDSNDFHAEYFAWTWKFNPETNNWTCVKKDNIISGFGTYGNLGIPNINNYPSSRTPASLWKDSSGMIWIFGGVAALGYYNDTWRYNPSTNEWTWMKGPNSWDEAGHYGTKDVPAAVNNPPPRSSSASWIDKDNHLWMFGGYWINPNVGWEFYNDLWMYDIPTNQWTWKGGTKEPDQPGNYGTLGVPDTSNIPEGRTCGCSWMDDNGNFYLYGGAIEHQLGEFFNNIWRYTPQTKEWTWMNGVQGNIATESVADYCTFDPDNMTFPRTESACSKINNKQVAIFGGFGTIPLGCNNRELWIYDIPSNQLMRVWGDSSWSKGSFGIKEVYDPANNPPSKMGATIWKENDTTLWIYGGNYCVEKCPEADLWKYTIDTSCNDFTGIDPITATIAQINIYPNPVHDQLRIDVGENISGDVMIKIRSITGVEVISMPLIKSPQEIDVQHLPAGIYLATVTQNGKQVWSEKVVKS